MIIACPACATRYAVPDSAIGVDGRTVRCAKCRHSWFQDGPEPAQTVAAAPPAAVPTPPPPAPPVAVEPAPVEVAPPPAEEDAPPPPIQDVPEPPVYSDEAPVPAYEDERSSFDYEPPFRQRRNPAKLWMIGAVIFALVAIGAIGAVAWYGLPNWVPFARGTFAQAEPNLVLDFPPNRQDRRTLPNGAEFFGASGSITNVGKTRQAVPVLLIVLRDVRDRIVYSWEVVPSKRELAPGESVTINEAVTDVPKSAKVAEIGWKPG
ncbi:MAG: zinc-ribbon domain-containing protein [Novosphingobium sp.]